MGLNLTLVALTLPEERKKRGIEACARWRKSHLEERRKSDRNKHAWKKWARENHPDEAMRTKLKDEWNRKLFSARIRNKRNYYKNKPSFKCRSMKRYARIKADPVEWRRKLDGQLDRVRQWRKKNPDKMRAASRRWSKTEKGRISTNKSKQKARLSKPRVAIACRVRSRINVALKRKYRGMREPSRVLLGCSFEELKRHLESLFVSGMTWENRAEWEIDHIRPCASFDLMDLEQQKCCFHYTNLQPLWKADNRKKSDKWA